MSLPSLIEEGNASGLIKRISLDPSIHQSLTDQMSGHFLSMYFKISPLSDKEVERKFREIAQAYNQNIIPYYNAMCFTYDSGLLGPLLQKPSTELVVFWDSFSKAMEEEHYSGDRGAFLSISIAMPINLCNSWKDMSISNKRMKNLFEIDLNKVWHQVIRRAR